VIAHTIGARHSAASQFATGQRLSASSTVVM
jgi:hypothetical protein